MIIDRRRPCRGIDLTGMPQFLIILWPRTDRFDQRLIATDGNPGSAGSMSRPGVRMRQDGS